LKFFRPLAACLLLACAGCDNVAEMVDPFAAATTKKDMAVPADRIGEVELLASDRKLPEGATNVRLYFEQFQDPFLYVRFDAPLADARKFVKTQTGKELELRCDRSVIIDPPVDWWLRSCPANSESASSYRSEDPPARHYLIVPKGEMATVWLFTFRD
jgi:hypothetical protein